MKEDELIEELTKYGMLVKQHGAKSDIVKDYLTDKDQELQKWAKAMEVMMETLENTKKYKNIN